jgi:cysteine synthase
MTFVDTERCDEILYTMEHGLPSVTQLPESLMSPIADIPASQQLKMYGFSGHAMQGANGKGMPAFKILLEERDEGRLVPGTPLWVPSSGNTAVNVAYFADAVGAGKVTGVINPGVPLGKQIQLRLPGAGIEERKAGQTTIERAYELQKEHGGLVIDQYKHWGSVRGHKWTMHHIIREMRRLKKKLSFLYAAAGTCSTLVAGDYLREEFPNLQVGGVACVEGQDIPGVRPISTIDRDITFPWRKAIAPCNFTPHDSTLYDLTLCDTYSAFAMSRELIKRGRPVGPSGGAVVEGFFRWFRRLHEAGELEQFINADGEYVVIFIFMDGYFMYAQEYTDVLGDKL